ncbi:MAG TPA: hypothetical protein VFT60_06695 [Bryobacteraceae bacterium]|nr:hypothetical protein [Bryobacteraceae bacterium]
MLKTIGLALFVLSLPAMAADISGAWDFQGSIEGNVVNMKCDFKQDAAAKITGRCAFEGLGTSDTTGDVTDDKVVLHNDATREQVYHLTWNATLDSAASAMTGEIVVGEYSGAFTAKKSTAAPTPGATAATASTGISGNWTFTGDVVGNPVNMKCALKQEEAKISGSCNYDSGDAAPTTGSVSGETVTFQNSAQNYDITYTATLDAARTSMKGDIEVAGVTGNFTGAKDK